MKVCEYYAKFLKEKHVKDIFGIPGSLIMPLWQQSGSMLHLCTNEVEACYIATGYGKKSHKPGIVLTTGSPGVTNSVSGIASANIDSVPLLHISGTIPISEHGNGLFQEESGINRTFKPSELLSSVTKAVYHPASMEEAIACLQKGWKQATTGRCGSVHISLPIDVQNKEVPYRIQVGLSDGYYSEKSAIPEIRINHMERPLIIAGWGVYMAECGEALRAFAETLQAPIMTTMKGMSSSCVASPLWIGSLGFRYNKILDHFLREYDPTDILVFGSSIGKKDFVPKFQDACKAADWHVFADDVSHLKKREFSGNIYLIESLKGFLNSLNGKTVLRKADKSLFERIKLVRKQYNNLVSEACSDEDIMASCIRYIMSKACSSQVIAADAGNHYLDAITFAKPCGEGSFFVDVGLAAMGIGISETIGMAYGNRSSQYIAITGDGCMLMDGNSLFNAVGNKLPILFIVFNNHSLGRVRMGQKDMGAYIASDIENVDFIKYAQSLGIRNAVSVGSLSDFTKVYHSYVSKHEPCFIEVVTSKDEIPIALREGVLW